MKRIRNRHLLRIGVSSLGAMLVLVALFADVLGIDANKVWGPSRKILLLFGCLIFFLGVWKLILKRFQAFVQRLRATVVTTRLYRNTQARISTLRSWICETCNKVALFPPIKRLHEELIGSLSRRTRTIRDKKIYRFMLGTQTRIAGTMMAMLLLVIIFFYVWIISVGRWTSWPSRTEMYDLLGQAFSQGQTHLPIDPSPDILALSDPYKFENRKTVKIPWDVSLYEGKYYLYFGPTPGVIVAALKSFWSTEISDNVLVFGFTSGVLITMSVLLLLLWRRYFQDLSWWFLIPCIAIAGLANPVIWLLNRPAVYEASISGGQFFLFVGILLSFVEIIGSPKLWRKFLIGSCWIFAIGSRASLIFSIIFLSVVFIGIIVWQRDGFKTTLKNIVAFIFPLILGAAFYAWYNYDRFDSIFELGHRYQLSSTDMHENYRWVLSLANLPPSIFNYFLNPYRTLPAFPFVKPLWSGHYLWPFHKLVPDTYYTEQITGIVISTPYLILALLPFVFSIRNLAKKRDVDLDAGAKSMIMKRDNELAWLSLCLTSSVILVFIPLLLYAVTTMRYLADVVPMLVLLASIGFWQSCQAMSGRTFQRRLWILIVLGLVMYSSVIGILLGITSYYAPFEKLNPELFLRLSDWFAW